MGKLKHLEVLEDDTHLTSDSGIQGTVYLKIKTPPSEPGKLGLEEAFEEIEKHDLGVGSIVFHDVPRGMTSLWSEDMQGYLRDFGVRDRVWGANASYSSQTEIRDGLPLRAVLNAHPPCEGDNVPFVAVKVYG